MSFYDESAPPENLLKSLVFRSNSAVLVLARASEALLVPLDITTGFVVEADEPIYKVARALGFEPVGTVGNTSEGVQAASVPGTAEAVMSCALDAFRGVCEARELELLCAPEDSGRAN